MEQILSSKTGFFAIVPAFTLGGITLMAIGYIEWGWVGFAVAVAWFFLFLLFKRQHIEITDIECGIQENTTMSDGFHPMGVSGFIKARHSIELLDCKLMVAKDKGEYPVSDGVELHQRIDNISRFFTFHIPIGKEDTSELLDWGLIYIRVAGKLLYISPFPITTKMPNNKGWFRVIAEKLIPKTKQLKDEGEITKKKLHGLLDKASQPIK